MVSLNRILLYVRDVEAVAEFYRQLFGFQVVRQPGDRIVELVPADGGASLMLHQAAKGQKAGQAVVKLVFDVEDVPAFCDRCAKMGLPFGPLHQADGYAFANSKDPAQNSISVSSRVFRRAE